MVLSDILEFAAVVIEFAEPLSAIAESESTFAVYYHFC